MGDHVRFGLHAGLTRDEIREALFTLNFYNGWPGTREASVVLNRIFDEIDAEKGNNA
jgi:alkylhydroperoxidase/carboxymuconolactone decarboxylase family protein YurZ